jgi:hypothetical protein
MAHTLPGFFSAITLFMLIDLWSPQKITPIITRDLSAFATFVGFVFLIGTILGIILSGIHHSIIEDNLFDYLPGMIELIDIRNRWIPRCEGFAFALGEDGFNTLKLSRHYSFKTIESNLSEINNFVIEDYYSYSGFYCNAFLSLIPFSIIVPYYLLENFQISWFLSLIFGFVSSILAIICLFSSYSSYKAYAIVVNSIIFGYVKCEGSSTTLPAIVKTETVEGKNKKWILKKLSSRGSIPVFVILSGILFIIFFLYINASLSPTFISVDPVSINESITNDNNSKELIKNIAIRNIGKDLVSLSVKLESGDNIRDINDNSSSSYINISLNPKRFQEIKNGDIKFLSVKIDASKAYLQGDYRGAIIINTLDKTIDEKIPLTLNIMTAKSR